MNREQALRQIWRETHSDYRGFLNGVKCILILRNGTCLVPLDSLTDTEISSRVKGYSND